MTTFCRGPEIQSYATGLATGLTNLPAIDVRFSPTNHYATLSVDSLADFVIIFIEGKRIISSVPPLI